MRTLTNISNICSCYSGMNPACRGGVKLCNSIYYTYNTGILAALGKGAAFALCACSEILSVNSFY